MRLARETRQPYKDGCEYEYLYLQLCQTKDVAVGSDAAAPSGKKFGEMQTLKGKNTLIFCDQQVLSH
jgi:hypothetical protein